jgi:hypothetical protein
VAAQAEAEVVVVPLVFRRAQGAQAVLLGRAPARAEMAVPAVPILP